VVSVRDAVVQADLNAFAEVLAPDVVWIGPYPGELCRNRGDVLEMFERWRQQEIRIQPTIVFERDDVLIVDSGLGGRHHVVVLDESLVSEVRVYPDRGAALASIEERPW
jgi:hypothetical protein